MMMMLLVWRTSVVVMLVRKIVVVVVVMMVMVMMSSIISKIATTGRDIASRVRRKEGRTSMASRCCCSGGIERWNITVVVELCIRIRVLRVKHRRHSTSASGVERRRPGIEIASAARWNIVVHV